MVSCLAQGLVVPIICMLRATESAGQHRDTTGLLGLGRKDSVMRLALRQSSREREPNMRALPGFKVHRPSNAQPVRASWSRWSLLLLQKHILGRDLVYMEAILKIYFDFWSQSSANWGVAPCLPTQFHLSAALVFRAS